MPSAAALRDSFRLEVQDNLRLTDETQHVFRGNPQEKAAIDRTYESTFLDVVTRFEVLLEDLFYAVALRESHIYRSGIVPSLSGVHTRAQLEDLLSSIERREYLDWLPFDRTAQRVDAFLIEGRPFTRLARHSTEGSILREAMIIRNAIAHRSGRGQKKFDALCPSGLPEARRTPAGLLQLSTGQQTTKYGTICNGLIRIAGVLSARSDIKSWHCSPQRMRMAMVITLHAVLMNAVVVVRDSTLLKR